MSTYEDRAIIAQTRRRLQGGRARQQETLLLCRRLELLADVLDAAQAELRRRDDLTYPYGRLVEDWNGLIEALRTLGIEVSQPADIAPRWEWRWGQETGEAATIPAAYLTALKVAGARRPAPPPVDQQLRAQGAAELPGLGSAPADPMINLAYNEGITRD